MAERTHLGGLARAALRAGSLRSPRHPVVGPGRCVPTLMGTEHVCLGSSRDEGRHDRRRERAARRSPGSLRQTLADGPAGLAGEVMLVPSMVMAVAGRPSGRKSDRPLNTSESGQRAAGPLITRPAAGASAGGPPRRARRDAARGPGHRLAGAVPSPYPYFLIAALAAVSIVRLPDNCLETGRGQRDTSLPAVVSTLLAE